MKNWKIALTSSLLILLPWTVVQGSSDIVEISVEAEFEDVGIDIDNAISNHGFVVDYKGHVGEMLNRTAKDVGSDVNIYRHADTWQFCSSVLSRQMIEINPANIAYCPYIVFAYELTAQPGTVIVGFRKHTTDDAATDSVLDTIDKNLASIVKEATE